MRPKRVRRPRLLPLRRPRLRRRPPTAAPTGERYLRPTARGIELTLTLSPDGRYEQTWNYIEREGIFTDRGPYMVEGDVLTLQPEDDGVALYYKLDGERLLKLDADRKPLDGEQAPYYELRKIAK